MSLGCGHAFCQYCIEKWQKSQKGGGVTCPNCRKKVESFHPALYLDNIIDSIFKEQPAKEQEDRRCMVEERKKQMEDMKKEPPRPAGASATESSDDGDDT